MEGTGSIFFLFPVFLIWQLGIMTRMKEERLAAGGGVPGTGDRRKGQNLTHCSLRNVPHACIGPLNWY